MTGFTVCEQQMYRQTVNDYITLSSSKLCRWTSAQFAARKCNIIISLYNLKVHLTNFFNML